MTDLKNWKEITKGLYRYVIAANLCYEIHLMHWAFMTDINTAKASLYLVGEWLCPDGSYFERECLLADQPVLECLKAAEKDDKENNCHD